MNFLVYCLEGYVIFSCDNQLFLELFIIKLALLHDFDKFILIDTDFLKEGWCFDKLMVYLDKMIELLPTEELLFWIAFVDLKKYFVKYGLLALRDYGIFHHESPKFEVVLAIVVKIFVQSFESLLSNKCGTWPRFDAE